MINKEQWQKENRKAIKAYNEFVDRYGLFSETIGEQYRVGLLAKEENSVLASDHEADQD